MLQEDALPSSTLTEQNQCFSLKNIQINSLQDFLSGESLTKVSNLDKIAAFHVNALQLER